MAQEEEGAPEECLLRAAPVLLPIDLRESSEVGALRHRVMRRTLEGQPAVEAVGRAEALQLPKAELP